MRKKGISLITLVITIVIIVILTGAIILSISGNNPISKASQAVSRQNAKTIMEAITSSSYQDLLSGVTSSYSNGIYSTSKMSGPLIEAIKADIGDGIYSHTFVEIDMNKLSQASGLPSGINGYRKTGNDIYVRDTETGNVYYVANPVPSTTNSSTVSSNNLTLSTTKTFNVDSGYTIESYYKISENEYYLYARDESYSSYKVYYYLNGNTTLVMDVGDGFYVSITPDQTNKVAYLTKAYDGLYLLEGANSRRIINNSNGEYVSVQFMAGKTYASGAGGIYIIQGGVATAISGGPAAGECSWGSLILDEDLGNIYYVGQGSDYSTYFLYKINGTTAQNMISASAYGNGMRLVNDGYGNLYMFTGEGDNRLFQVNGDGTLRQLSWTGGSPNGVFYRVGKEVFLATMQDLYRITTNGGQLITGKVGDVGGSDPIYDGYNDITYWRFGGKIYKINNDNTSTKVSDITGYYYSSINYSKGDVFVYGNGKVARLIYNKSNNSTSLTELSGLPVGATSSGLYINNYTGESYVYTYNSGQYAYFKVTGNAVEPIKMPNNSNMSGDYVSICINKYNGHMVFVKDNVLYKIQGALAVVASEVTLPSGDNSISNDASGQIIITNINNNVTTVYSLN